MPKLPATNEARLKTLWDLAALLADESDPRKLVPLILDQAVALVGAERGFVILLRPGADFEVAAARNIDQEAIQRPEFKVSRSIVSRVANSGAPELISDAASEA